MDAKRIPIVKVGRAGAAGTPDDFEQHFSKQRKKGSGRVVSSHQPKLKPIENLSMKERMSKVGIDE